MLIIGVMVAIHAWNTRSLPVNEALPVLPSATLSGVASDIPEGESGVIYFFAPWCFYCRHSIDNLEALVQQGDIAWARAVALDWQTPAEVEAFVAETGWTQPVLMGDAETHRAWGVRAYPTYFVVSADGHIDSRSVGYSTRLGLRARAWLSD